MSAIGYKICILGETQEQAQKLLFELVEANQKEVAGYNLRDRAELSDGTLLIARSARQARQRMDGYRFDEVFFGGTVEQYKDFLYVLRVLDMCCVHSEVPPDFRWWTLKDLRKETTYV